MTMITLTTGTAFMMWIGEQITERGIGNGISLIIFASIVSGIPGGVGNYFAANEGDIQPLTIAVVLAIVVVSIAIDRVLRARRSAGSRSSTRAARSADACMAGRRRTCRSR